MLLAQKRPVHTLQVAANHQFSGEGGPLGQGFHSDGGAEPFFRLTAHVPKDPNKRCGTAFSADSTAGMGPVVVSMHDRAGLLCNHAILTYACGMGHADGCVGDVTFTIILTCKS